MVWHVCGKYFLELILSACYSAMQQVPYFQSLGIHTPLRCFFREYNCDRRGDNEACAEVYVIACGAVRTNNHPFSFIS
jgi:hypothetical protein